MDFIAAGAVAGTIIGAFTAVTGVVATITQRIIERRKETLEFVSRIELDPEFIGARNEFNTAARKGSLARFAARDHEGGSDASAIATLLNQFEIISLGIQCGMIDYTTYMRFAAETVQEYWRLASPFVEALQKRIDKEMKAGQIKVDAKAVYCEFRKMESWSRKKTRPPGLWYRGIVF